MNLEIGQYINDGETDLLVCDIKEIDGKRYTFLLDEEKDIGCFFEMKKKNDLWEFSRVKLSSEIKQLIIHFSNIKDKFRGINYEL